jgi:SAM-dependent methyltransferase
MASDAEKHFQRLATQWDKIGLPMRPLSPVASVLKSLMPENTKQALLLGVTPEFAALAEDTTALDHSAGMIAQIWPGDGPNTRAVQGSWLNMPFEDDSFDVVIGDGSLTLLPFPEKVENVLSEIARVLRPDARAVLRCFVALDNALTDDELRSYATSLKNKSIDALRFRFAINAVHAANSPNITAAQAWRDFAELYPDPEPMLSENGWNVADFARFQMYKDNSMSMNFPNRAQLSNLCARHFSAVSFHDSGDYPMAELCPIVVMTNAR